MIEFLAELLIELLAEPLLSVAARALAATLPAQWRTHAWLAALGYTLLGLVFGIVSLWVRPQHSVQDPVLRGVTWLLSPLLCALSLALVGWIRRARGKPASLLDGARYGALFAVTLQLVRLLALGP